MAVNEIKSIRDIIDLAENHKHDDPLFRGHRTSGDLPVPRFFRKNAADGIDTSKIECGFEPMIGHEFKDYAASVYSRCPQDKACFEWLALMQHHGTPTRLLDWTRNILVAAYFAVELVAHIDNQTCGEIWILNSRELTKITRDAHKQDSPNPYRCSCWNHRWNEDKFPYSIDGARDRLAEQAFADFRFRETKHCKVEDTCRFPLTVAPARTFSRLVTQRSWFTIHPTPNELKWARPRTEHVRQDEEVLLLNDLKSNGAPILTNHIIPSNCKRSIINSLGALCITRATLFPDLDGLAQSLIPEIKRRFRSLEF